MVKRMLKEKEVTSMRAVLILKKASGASTESYDRDTLSSTGRQLI
jgi:hypothetical protein